MNSNYDTENPVEPVAHASSVRARKRPASALTAKRDVSQPAHETGALSRAATRNSSVIKAANVYAQDRGVEVIVANHGCSRSAPALDTPDAAPPADEVRCNEWESFALFCFIVLSFAGLFFCFYVILAKCRGTWPF